MDPIANMLTIIRNAQAVSKNTAVFPFSKIKFELAKLLEKTGFIGEVSMQGKKVRKIIEVQLKYEDENSVISGIKRISKPSRRVYIRKNEIKPVKNGYGLMILSTPHGLMSGQEARKKGLGGEVICEVW